MKVEFKEMNNSNYAINPRHEKINGLNCLKISCGECTHILLLKCFFDNDIKLYKDIKDMIKSSLADPSILNKEVKLENGYILKFIDFVTLKQNRNIIKINDYTGIYAVFACVYNRVEDCLNIYVSNNELVNYKIYISHEIEYSITRLLKYKKHGVFKKRDEVIKTNYYEVVIGNQDSNFSDNDIRYRIVDFDLEQEFPITNIMKGKKILIKTDNGVEPEIVCVSNRIKLIRES